MAEIFKINLQGIEESREDDKNLEIHKNISSEDEQAFLNKYNLPEDVFYFDKITPVAPRYESIQNDLLGETIIFVLANVFHTNKNSNIEQRLESHIFVLGEKQLFWFVKNFESELDTQIIEKHQNDIISLESVIIYAGLQAYTHFTKELTNQKEKIDELNQQASHTTNNDILLQVTKTERNLVMLEHTIYSQEDAFERLLKNNQFLEQLDNNQLVHDIKWYNRQVKKLVHVYRDLFDAVSNLFSDLVSNNLNMLMKFLSSLSLILAASGLVASLWGMNTSDLPFEQGKYGTFIMIGVAVLAGTVMYLFLKNKDFFD